MSAAYALPGDVIEVKSPLPVQSADGAEDELTPGYYVLGAQFWEGRLALASVGEGEDGAVVACRPVYIVRSGILQTDAVGITYLKVSRWAGGEDEWTTGEARP